MMTFSPLERNRLIQPLALPAILQDLQAVICEKKPLASETLDPHLMQLFPLTFAQPALLFKRGRAAPASPLRVGVVLSGGQAPGGHNVICGLWDALKKLHSRATLIGFLNGPSGLIKNQFMILDEEKIAPYRNQGGFDMLGSGRTKIETPEQFQAVEKTLLLHGLDGLVIIGGDDSNTNAAFLAEFCRQRHLPTRVVGVPKTIDGDLKNAWIEISFGFDTASKVYAEIIGNLLKDALSAKKYYFFIKIMGRSASHLALECALQTHVNLTLIGEEIVAKRQTLKEIVEHIADLVCQRAAQGKHFGAILIPEGLLEFIPECQEMLKECEHLLLSNILENSPSDDPLSALKQHLTPAAANCLAYFPDHLQQQLLLERDPHGNMQLSKIETERLLMTLVEKTLHERRQQGIYQGNFNPQPFFCGYEGRSSLPSAFDAHYCHALGHVAALLIHHQASGYMCCIKKLAQPTPNWEVCAVPLVHMLHFEERQTKRRAVIQKALVDLKGPVFTVFKQTRETWRIDDCYCAPGPIQFAGPTELVEARTFTLLYEQHQDLAKKR